MKNEMEKEDFKVIEGKGFLTQMESRVNKLDSKMEAIKKLDDDTNLGE
jgi:hypothetical protein